MKVAFEPLEGGVVDEWDALCDASRAAPFLRPGWFTAWGTSFGADGMVLATGREGSELVAAAPVLRRAGQVRCPTNWHTPEYRAVAVDAAAEQEFAATLARAAGHALVVAFVDEESATAAGLEDSEARLSTKRLILRSPLLLIDAPWEDYERTLARDTLKSLRRRRRRLDEEGEVAFDVLDGTVGLDALLEEGFRIELGGWKGLNGTAIASRAETKSFYVGVARWAAQRGLLQLGTLRLDGRLLAFHFDLVTPDAVFGLKGSFDQDFERFAPGKILTDHMVRRAFADGRNRYAFLGADEPYKREWTNSETRLVEIRSFDRSVQGRVGFGVATRLLPSARALRARYRSRRGPDRRARATAATPSGD